MPVRARYRVGRVGGPTHHGGLAEALAVACGIANHGQVAQVTGPGGAVTVHRTPAGSLVAEPAGLLAPPWIDRARSVLANYGEHP